VSCQVLTTRNRRGYTKRQHAEDGFPRGQLGGVIGADLLTDLTEIAVGVACLASAPYAWRRARWLGVLLAVAGLTAVVHALVSLVR